MASSDSSISPNSYHDRFNPEILKLIPPDARCVLEIGCGTGRLAEAYRRINPAATWYGVESHYDSSNEARKRMTGCFFGSVEYFIDYRRLEHINPDVVILGDVIEHLDDPWDVLNGLAGIAADGAQILASIPNVGHWTIIRDLMAGHWTYADEGLMDKTHLRWFTLEGIKEMFADAGLHIFEVRGRTLCNDGFEDWCQKLKIENPPQEWLAYQYVIRALKPGQLKPFVNPFSDEAISGLMTALNQSPSGKVAVLPEPLIEYKMSRLAIHAVVHRCPENGNCCERPRIDEPLAAMATIPGVRTSTSDGVQLDTLTQLHCHKIDVLIQQRFQRFGFGVQQEIVNSGAIVVAEWDDNPEAFPTQQASDFLALRAVHAVQVSTEPLAEIVRKYNPNVAVFPNQLAELPPWEDRQPSEQVRIFFGALNREADWKPIMPALREIISSSPREIIINVVADREFFDALPIGYCRKTFNPFLPYPEYMALLRSCNIALLPLEPTPFNEAKSDIKFLECAANGVVPICGQTVYSELRQFKIETPPFYTTPERFSCILRLFIDDVALRRSVAQYAYAYVRDHRMLGQHYRCRYEWYQSLIADREMLHRELLIRVPELNQKSTSAPQPATEPRRAPPDRP